MRTDSKSNQMESFLEVYAHEILPKIKEIDLYIKTLEGEIHIMDVSELLEISPEEISWLKEELGVCTIDNAAFFKIMEMGTSDICKMYKREVDCGSPYIYTRENIAYIYNLDQGLVDNICEALGIKEATSYNLPLIFSYIYLD